jgi:hypothetical protein
MTHHNATQEPLSFDIRGVQYDVPPSGNVDIPEDLVYVVRARGLRLVKGASPSKDAPLAKVIKLRPVRPKLPRGVELGPIRQKAREDNEDLDEGGDGPELEGDDADIDPAEDPIEKSVRQLEAQGVDLDALVGGRRRRK